MIKINNWFSDEVKDIYYNQIYDIVKSKYNHFKNTFQNNEYLKEFILNDLGEIDENKLRLFLTKKKKEIFDTDKKLDLFNKYVKAPHKVSINNEQKELIGKACRKEQKKTIYTKKEDYLKKIWNDSSLNDKQYELKLEKYNFPDFKSFVENYGQIGYLFDYNFIKDDLRHKLISSLNMSVCPYCNRQYITSWNDKNNKKTTADLDHFYPKSIFPAFSLSLFNFVPSCQICNSRMKGDKWSDVIYPYEERFGDDAYFEVVNLEKKIIMIMIITINCSEIY